MEICNIEYYNETKMKLKIKNNMHYVPNIIVNVGMHFYNLELIKSIYSLINSPLPIEFCLAVFKLLE